MPPLLPAVVPEIPENRAEVAAARLARKIAPLFGVPWPDGPFGARTWVCDYAKITLSEIARGAPLPTRAEAARLGDLREGDWQLVDRIGVAGRRTPMPNEIANATLNRFGPDTRAAVVLTAVNRLLAPVCDALVCALSLLVDGSGARLPDRLRLAAWAGLVVEVFRSQPALLAAGIHARAIQAELVQSWQLPLAVGLDALPLTRCEVGPTAPPASATARPCTLDVAEHTLAALQWDGAPPGEVRSGEVRSGEVEDDETPAELSGRLRAAETVDLLLRRLLAAGTSADASYLWLSEREAGQLAVEALLPPTDLVDRFVRQCTRSRVPTGPDPEPPEVLPAVPTAEQLAALPVLARRALLIALVTVLRHIQNSPQGRERSRHNIVPVLAGIARLADEVLAPDDPVACLTACRVADMTVQTLRADLRNDLRGPVRDLLAGLDRCADLLRRGLLDRGAAAEVISSACVELNVLRRTNAQRPGAGLPTPDELDQRLRRSWRTYHEALEIPPFVAGSPARLPGLVGYHLQNFAAYLAGSADEAEVGEAVELFTTVVIPAREEFCTRSGHFPPLRHTLQVASRATTRLAEAARDRGDIAEATRWAGVGRGWVLRALADDDTRLLISTERPTESACRFALLAAPALVLAVELGAEGASRADVAQAAQLVELAQRWELHAVGGGAQHARHQEVVALVERVTALRACPAPAPGA
jgi:hypothetical protein